MRIASDVRKHTAVLHVVAVDDESYPLFHVALCVEKGCARDGIAPLEAAAKIILWFRLCLYNRIVHRCALYLYPAHEIRIVAEHAKCNFAVSRQSVKILYKPAYTLVLFAFLTNCIFARKM